MTIVVTGAASEQYAIDLAKHQFERSKHVVNWICLAAEVDNCAVASFSCRSNCSWNMCWVARLAPRNGSAAA